MSLKDIENRIIEQARAEAERIKKDGDSSVQRLEQNHADRLAELKQKAEQSAKLRAEEVKRSLIVPARLAARKALLEEKQKILSHIYKEIKKIKKLSDADLNKLREESEVRAAQLLFS